MGIPSSRDENLDSDYLEDVPKNQWLARGNRLISAIESPRSIPAYCTGHDFLPAISLVHQFTKSYEEASVSFPHGDR